MSIILRLYFLTQVMFKIVSKYEGTIICDALHASNYFQSWAYISTNKTHTEKIIILNTLYGILIHLELRQNSRMQLIIAVITVISSFDTKTKLMGHFPLY